MKGPKSGPEETVQNDDMVVGVPPLHVEPRTRQGIFVVAMLLCLSPAMGPPLALLLGLVLALTIGDPFAAWNRQATNWL